MKKIFSEITDVKKLQILMDKFTIATGLGTAILDTDGNVLVASGWQDICTKYHRVNPASCKNCFESDTSLANNIHNNGKDNVYKCLNGLVDVAVPIIVNNTHLGNLFIGQFLSEKPDIEFFRKQAVTYGFDVDEYMQALSKVPIISLESVEKHIAFLTELALLVGDLGMNKLELLDLTANLEQKVEERTINLQNAQIETEALNKRLERSNKELEQFAYVASHDLQEPLRMISSYTQLLEKRYKDKLDQDATDFIGFAVDGANRMQRLINDLLEYSRVTTRGKEFVKLDLSSVLGIALSNLQQKIKETHTMVTNDDLPFCRGDEIQLVRVFQNLIDNAIKFSTETSPRIHIACEPMDDAVRISISDNGIGIEPQYQERVFVIFQRLNNKAEYPGTGIGLAICKRTIERHGGKIWFVSEPGKGTTFFFTLPTK